MQPKVCESDRQEPTIDGVCVCSGDTVDINGECVDNAIFAAIGAVGGFLVLVAICVAYVRYKNFKADEMWTVHLDELLFDDPVEVIGQGSFGVVLLAEYRGTKVRLLLVSTLYCIAKGELTLVLAILSNTRWPSNKL